MIPKEASKALRAEKTRQEIESIKQIPPAEFGAECDIHDVRAHIVAGDLDLAEDVARTLPDAVLRKVAEDEVRAARQATTL
jgi:hypothetical protein